MIPPDHVPTVSIVLPTYNRAKFLPRAFASIRDQQFHDWELVVVDDGSTDDTRALVESFAAEVPRPVVYRHQANAGAYPARVTGLRHARGEYIAFFDSDDWWLPHHLARSVEALAAHADVDWVYGACRMVDFPTGKELAASTFHVNGRPRPFMKLRAQRRGDLHVIVDRAAARCQIRDGLYCGLQNSVIRRSVFDRVRIHTDYWNEAEDQLFTIRALAAGCRLAYLDQVHVQYHVHEANSSGSAIGAALDRRLRLHQAVIRGFEDLQAEAILNAAERRALRRRLAQEYFWVLGYALLWSSGRRQEALDAFRHGLRLDPWKVSCWKTYLLALARTRLHREGQSASKQGAVR